ncbi:MAG: IS110 family transposase [Mesorhizobium sp.]|nr:MAG: hypothetical protein EOS41_23195 [Mesorhizobium sp.]TGQ19079.1 hypothetical protein EN860_021680 [Mesorhizobium sp. M00.F.Ca.ET.217.01.1.1]TGV89967.1 hypothetical protein EN801_020005 [Mesorhizobium sp. M00.F.Ca.ET.158.01.1.1]TIU87628.1 MAG: IS110 family transposase [Mesorhizobium sp.]TIW22709.1 MAG: IS110 family transposase [Mesorhizobium sp.]
MVQFLDRWGRNPASSGRQASAACRRWPDRRARARDMAAWLGLVPREYSTEAKRRLGVGKRGNRYLRRMIILGARSCVTNLDRSRHRLGAWLDGLQARCRLTRSPSPWRQDCADRMG